MPTEQTVTEDALTQSLDALLKAANTTASLKKGGIVNSGFEDERGKQGGGQGSKGDAGGIESLMIGKLVASGMDAAAAGEIVGELSGLLTEQGLIGHKRDEEEEEEEEREEKDGEDDEDEDMRGYARGYADAMAKMGKSETAAPSGETLAKSITESFTGDKDIAEGVNATPFLEALTARTTESLGALAKAMDAQDKRQTGMVQKLAHAVVQIGQLAKSQSAVIDELGKRLGVVEKQPATGPKGARTLQGAQALKKSIEGGEGGEQLIKGSDDMAAVLSYLRFAKSMDTIEGEPIGQAAIMAEAGGVVSPAVREYANKWLATHPAERQAALSYR